MGNWIKWQFDTHYRPLPKSPACYVVYLNGNLSYIGQTSNLFKRFAQYNIRFGFGRDIITPWGSVESVDIKYRPTRKYGDWAMIELRLIKKLQPSQNCAGSIKKRQVSK